jgi:hypothetical protein
MIRQLTLCILGLIILVSSHAEARQGARLYNKAILATMVGTAAMRVTKQFQSGRKLAKTHQNVLVFCKGDWRAAAAKCNGIGNA